MCVKQKNSLLKTSLQQHVSARFKVWLYKVIQDRVFITCEHSNCVKIKVSVFSKIIHIVVQFVFIQPCTAKKWLNVRRNM